MLSYVKSCGAQIPSYPITVSPSPNIASAPAAVEVSIGIDAAHAVAAAVADSVQDSALAYTLSREGNSRLRLQVLNCLYSSDCPSSMGQHRLHSPPRANNLKQERLLTAWKTVTDSPPFAQSFLYNAPTTITMEAADK